jgi:hypothetical protein
VKIYRTQLHSDEVMTLECERVTEKYVYFAPGQNFFAHEHARALHSDHDQFHTTELIAWRYIMDRNEAAMKEHRELADEVKRGAIRAAKEVRRLSK